MPGSETHALLLQTDPLPVAAEIRRIRRGSLATPARIRSALARKLGAEVTCPLTTGIFLNILVGEGLRKTGQMKVKAFNRRGELVGPVESPRVVKSDAEWRAQLTLPQYRIARGKDTERPFCGTLLDNKREGVYRCVCCGLPLFASGGKFNSGTGWPSFFQPIAAENVCSEEDRSHGMARTEILCARCDAHLGHAFNDGPAPSGLRYCVNSESLEFIEQAELASLADPAAEP